MTIKIALLVPTYNEAVSIVELLDKLTEFRANKTGNFDVIVIDDNSPDGTANIVDNLHLPWVSILRRPGKGGLGAAYRAGFVQVLADSSYTATEGIRVAVLNAGDDVHGEAVTQTFATVPGAIYELRFDAGIIGGQGKKQRIAVSVPGANPPFSGQVDLQKAGSGSGHVRTRAKRRRQDGGRCSYCRKSKRRLQ